MAWYYSQEIRNYVPYLKLNPLGMPPKISGSKRNETKQKITEEN